MNTIKQITLSQKRFIIESEESSLKLKYTQDDERYIIDISSMNLFEATKTAILCSTYCFLHNFEKKLCWLVKDEATRKAISILRLRNMEQFVKDAQIQKSAVFA